MISSEDTINVVAAVPTASLDEVAAALEALGLTDTKKMDKLGLITGQLKRGMLHKASQVPGVKHIREQRGIALASTGGKPYPFAAVLNDGVNAADVATILATLGGTDLQPLQVSGIVTGTFPDDDQARIAAAESIPGVQCVEKQVEMHAIKE